MNVLNNETVSTQKKTILLVGLSVLALAIVAAAIIVLLSKPNAPESPSPKFIKAEKAAAKNDEISAIVSKAEKSASKNDYDSAYEIASDGLKDYPDSKELQDKSVQYKSNRDNIDDIINQAMSNASNGSFDRAVEIISEGLETYPGSQKLRDISETIAELMKKAQPDPEPQPTPNSQPTSDPQTTPDTPSTPGPDSEPTPAPTQTYVFPAHWSGSYLGNTLDADGNSIPAQRMVWFNLTESNGQISGTCSVGTDDGSANVDGTFTVTGTFNHDTREITINGSEWVDQGDLWGMRNFWGTVSADNSTMSGRCVGLNSGKEGDWSASSD